MKTQRELAIDAYIQQHPDANVTPLTGPRDVLFHGSHQSLPVLKLPTSLLVFNIGNGRFAAELIAQQQQLKRNLDTAKPEDAKIVRKLLLEQNAGETEVLKADLQKNGQLDPGIITFDGAVINANRRMAIFQTLHEATADERFEFLKVVRLPRGVDEKDLWKIEAKLQFGRDFRLEYGPINELLKIRVGRQSGLSELQISDALGGRYSVKDVAEKLEILKLIDSYLHSIGKSGEYKIIQEERIVEKFNSLQANVISPLKRGAHKSEIPRITEVGFSMIEGKKHSHWKIRKLRDVAELKEARNTLYTSFDKKGKLATKGTTVEDAFDAAEFIVDAQEEKERPEKLAGKALSALKEIDVKHEAIAKPEFQKILGDIRAEANRLSDGKAKKRGKASR